MANPPIKTSNLEVEKGGLAQSGSLNCESLAEDGARCIHDMQWQDLHAYGKHKAIELRLEHSDIERLIAESRAEHGSSLCLDPFYRRVAACETLP